MRTNQAAVSARELKPETCGQCERFIEDGPGGLSSCVPIKDKYGWEPVLSDQPPSINCCYENSHCDICGSPLFNGNCSENYCNGKELIQ